MFAAQAFNNFIFVLLFSVLFLIPQQGPHGLGLPLLGMDIFGLYMTVHRFVTTRSNSSRIWGRRNLALRFALPLVCFATLLVVAISVLLGSTGWLYWMVPVMIPLITDASVTAWNLLFRLREPGNEN